MLKLENGATPILHLTAGDTLEFGIVLAKYLDQYVVWNFHESPEGKYWCTTGDYFKQEHDARVKFRKRVEEFLGWRYE